MLSLLTLSLLTTLEIDKANSQSCSVSDSGERLIFLESETGGELVHYFTTEEAQRVAQDLAELEVCQEVGESLEHSLVNLELQLDSATLTLESSREGMISLAETNAELFEELVAVNRELRRPSRNFWLAFSIGSTLSAILTTIGLIVI
jgi:hypothetical protein